MMKKIIIIIFIFAALFFVGIFFIFQKINPENNSLPVEQKLKLRQKDSDTPAAGICDFARGGIAVVNIYNDVPQPRCIKVSKDQKLQIINMADKDIVVGFGNDSQIYTDVKSVKIAPQGYFRSEVEFGQYLELGVHILRVEPFGGPAIWLTDFLAKDGYIKSIASDNNQIKILFDEIKFLSGREAEEEAIKDGVCTQDKREECLPNNFYIQNKSEDIQVFALDSNIRVVMQTINTEGGIHDTVVTLEEFSKLINDQNLHWKDLPYSLVVVDDKVISIHEIYIP